MVGGLEKTELKIEGEGDRSDGDSDSDDDLPLSEKHPTVAASSGPAITAAASTPPGFASTMAATRQFGQVAGCAPCAAGFPTLAALKAHYDSAHSNMTEVIRKLSNDAIAVASGAMPAIPGAEAVAAHEAGGDPQPLTAARPPSEALPQEKPKTSQWGNLMGSISALDGGVPPKKTAGRGGRGGRGNRGGRGGRGRGAAVSLLPSRVAPNAAPVAEPEDAEEPEEPDKDDATTADERDDAGAGVAASGAASEVDTKWVEGHGEQCARSDGKGWRCLYTAVAGRRLCRRHDSSTKRKSSDGAKRTGRELTSEDEGDNEEDAKTPGTAVKRPRRSAAAIKKGTTMTDEANEEEEPTGSERTLSEKISRSHDSNAEAEEELPPMPAGYGYMKIGSSKKDRKCAFCDKSCKPAGIKRHIAAGCLSVPSDYNPAAVPPGCIPIRLVDTSRNPVVKSAKPAAPEAEKRMRDSSTKDDDDGEDKGGEGEDGATPGVGMRLRRTRSNAADEGDADTRRSGPRRTRAAAAEDKEPANTWRSGATPSSGGAKDTKATQATKVGHVAARAQRAAAVAAVHVAAASAGPTPRRKNQKEVGPLLHVQLDNNRGYKCAFSECKEKTFTVLAGLKRHVTVCHRGHPRLKHEFTVIPESEARGAAAGGKKKSTGGKSSAAATASVAGTSLVYGGKNALDEEEDDDDDAFEMRMFAPRATGSRGTGGQDKDATEVSSENDDDDDDDDAQGTTGHGHPARGPRGRAGGGKDEGALRGRVSAGIGLARVTADVDGADDDGDADSEMLMGQAEAAAKDVTSRKAGAQQDESWREGGGRKRNARAANIPVPAFSGQKGQGDGRDTLEGEGMNHSQMAGEAKRARRAAKPTAPEVPVGGRKKEVCGVCGKKFIGAQGVPSHYKAHIKKGTPEEAAIAQRCLDQFKLECENRRKAVKTAKLLKDDEDEAQEPEIESAPLMLGPSARNCSLCSSRAFATQAALIAHMWDEHEVTAIAAGSAGYSAPGARDRDRENEPGWNSAAAAATNGGPAAWDHLGGTTGGGVNGAGRSWSGEPHQTAAAPGFHQYQNHQYGSALAASNGNGPAENGGGGRDEAPGNGNLVHQHAFPHLLAQVAEAGPGGVTPVPNELLLGMVDQISQHKRDIDTMQSQIQLLSTMMQSGQTLPFDPRAEIKRIPIRGAKVGYNPIVTFGRMVYLTGIVALHTVDSDVEGQTWQALEHMKKMLEMAGTNLHHLLRITVILSDIRTVDNMYKAWNEFFELHKLSPEGRPVRITHQATLKDPGFRVEVHAEAVLPGKLPPPLPPSDNEYA